MRVPTCTSTCTYTLNLAGHSYGCTADRRSLRAERTLFRVAKGGRYLAAASSAKHIGTNGKSDLQWSGGKELPGYPSVGVQAAQRQRSSVEQGI